MIYLDLTVSDDANFDWTAQIYMNYNPRTHVGLWQFTDKTLDWKNLLCWNESGYYTRVGPPGSPVYFWDKYNQDRPAFVLYNAPVSERDNPRTKVSIGEIKNPRNPAGTGYGL